MLRIMLLMKAISVPRLPARKRPPPLGGGAVEGVDI